MKINTKKMKKMEKEYAELRKKEQEEMIELKVSKIVINLVVQIEFKINFISILETS